MQAFSMAAQKPCLIDQVRDALRRKHYSYRTEKTYLHWIRRFIYFHHKRHPRDMVEPDIHTIQELLGHRDVSTTMIYTHVLERGARGVASPMDTLSLPVSGNPA